MSSIKVGRNDACPCGSGKKHKQCCLQVRQQAAPLPKTQGGAMGSPAELLSQAIQLFVQGHDEAAASRCQAVLQRVPSQPDALHLCGLIGLRQGRPLEALQFIDRALSSEPANDTMHSNRGIVLQALGRHEEALTSLRRALDLDPRGIAAWTHQGLSLMALLRLDEAELSFRAGLDLAPSDAAALNGLGQCLLRAGRLDEAARVLTQACIADPQSVTARTNLGVVHAALGRHEEALVDFQQLVALAPDRAESWDRLGGLLQEMGEAEPARDAFTRAYQLEPQPARLLRKSLVLSHVHRSLESMREERQQFEAQLEALLAAPAAPAEFDMSSFLPGIFSLAYQGDDVLPALRKLATLYLKLFPGLAWTAPHVTRPADGGRGLRIGFFTSYVHDHAVAHCFAPLMQALVENAGFEIHLISHRQLPLGEGRRPYAGYTGRFVEVSDRLTDARQEIAALELDILVYQDIGMEALSYFLGFARLARLQCVMGGHPVTTGLPEMDVHLSSSLGEPDDAQAHYSERLVMLDAIPASCEQPTLPSRFKSKLELGLPSEGNLYVCPVMLQKIHPDFDRAVAGILEADPHGYVVFFKHASLPLDRHLRSRFEQTIAPELRERVLFLPWVRNRDDFAAINALAAVILDPFHFGIGSTAATTMAVATPFVTLPGKFLRGRVGLAYARMLEVEACVAIDAADYVRKAVQIACDPALRDRLSAGIQENRSRFFDNQAYLAQIRGYLASGREGPGAAPRKLMDN
ncbi:tetratricopeptide repeat protein [Roseateles toxinivorans]|uniref:protein O-GlcNAc transferase n=1 Tax=Roseateles toxinivorans TaxID=270368 RepID=A0A4R6QQ69_9BURK|nr:tetratricopeptide repeat protein [Roseateles toxinivorans]TDP71384.1 putative O-linked N-acetylglucosamine transferase (SPINDLY family) [Roseateles toxinivorans]